MKSVFLHSKDGCGSSDVIINTLHALRLSNKKEMASKKVKSIPSQALKLPAELETNSMRICIYDMEKHLQDANAFMHFVV